MRFDDFNLNLTNKQLLFQNVSVSFQENIILNSSLLDNIILNQELDQKRLDKISEICNISDILSNYKSNNLLESGKNLSGGQIQRICLARALYKNADFYIFDEPTSSLDSFNETIFLESLRSFLSDKFILIITHNEIILNFSDKIYELKNSKLKKSVGPK